MRRISTTALRFLPDRLPSRKKIISSSRCRRRPRSGGGRLLVVDAPWMSPCRARSLFSRSWGVILVVCIAGHRSGSYFGSLLRVDFLIRRSVTTSSPTATSRVIRYANHDSEPLDDRPTRSRRGAAPRGAGSPGRARGRTPRPRRSRASARALERIDRLLLGVRPDELDDFADRGVVGLLSATMQGTLMVGHGSRFYHESRNFNMASTSSRISSSAAVARSGRSAATVCTDRPVRSGPAPRGGTWRAPGRRRPPSSAASIGSSVSWAASTSAARTRSWAPRRRRRSPVASVLVRPVVDLRDRVGVVGQPLGDPDPPCPHRDERVSAARRAVRPAAPWRRFRPLPARRRRRPHVRG